MSDIQRINFNGPQIAQKYPAHREKCRKALEKDKANE